MRKNHFSKDTNPIKRISNRRYNPRICLKPDCAIEFVPTDKRQKFCVPQHRIDYHNDQRSIRSLPGKLLENRLQHNQAILMKIYGRMHELGNGVINDSLLVYEKFDFNTFSHVSVVKATGRKIYWNYYFGIEGYDSSVGTYLVHKRENLM